MLWNADYLFDQCNAAIKISIKRDDFKQTFHIVIWNSKQILIIKFALKNIFIEVKHSVEDFSIETFKYYYITDMAGCTRGYQPQAALELWLSPG